MIAIVDYGMGNLRSVHKALEKIGAEAVVTADPCVMARAQGIVLPGVGAFGAAVKRLQDKKLMDVLRREVGKGKPFLGICLGLQLLFDSSEESPGVPGLGLIPGTVVRMKPGLKIPHMGWNQVKFTQRALLFRGIRGQSYFYFVHSYMVIPQFKDVAAGVTDYGGSFVSAVKKANLFGVQFHPEKSQDLGLRLLKNFSDIVRVPLVRTVYQAERKLLERRHKKIGRKRP